LGFALLGPANRNLDRDFAQPPLARFEHPDDARPGACASECQSVSA
jgi:hypothetical protein